MLAQAQWRDARPGFFRTLPPAEIAAAGGACISPSCNPPLVAAVRPPAARFLSGLTMVLVRARHLGLTARARSRKGAPWTEFNQKGASENMAQVGGIAGEQLRTFIERIERLEDEKKDVQEQIKEVFSEAKGVGFDTRIMRQLVRLRRLRDADRSEQEELLEIYKAAIGMR
jgi:uncharacterized protein (UPF0335 family)